MVISYYFNQIEMPCLSQEARKISAKFLAFKSIYQMHFNLRLIKKVKLLI